jgi:hypothetical protein
MNPLAPVTRTRFFDSLMTDVLLRAGAARVQGLGATARCLREIACAEAVPIGYPR